MSNRTIALKDIGTFSAGDATGSAVISCLDTRAANLFVGFKLVTSAADFVATLGFAASAEDDGLYTAWPLLNFGIQITTTTLITTVNGITSFATGLAAGTYRGVLRIASPPPYVIPRLDFTSGGGTYALQLKAAY